MGAEGEARDLQHCATEPAPLRSRTGWGSSDVAIMPLQPDSPGTVLNEEFFARSSNALAAVDPGLAELGGGFREENRCGGMR